MPNRQPATYAHLFPEQLADRCSPDALEANNSPVAYLDALYREALELEKSSTDTGRLTLADRRPDIGELLIDAYSVTEQVPALGRVISALSRKAQQHAGDKMPLAEAIAEARRPAGLPFHYALEQIKTVLRHRGVPLLDLFQQTGYFFPNFCCGQLRSSELRHAMRCAAGFSPALQTLLLDNTDASVEGFITQRYGPGATAEKLKSVEFFCQAMSLKPEDVLDLLATSGVADDATVGFTTVKQARGYQPSTLSPLGGHLYGAQFINNATAPAMTVEDNHQGPGIQLGIKNATAAHFGRMYLLIHLQRALQLPFAEVDTLLMATLRAQGQSRDFHITEDTLRSLGVFQHFQAQYKVTAEQFAALIHEVTPYTVGDTSALLDRVIDGPGLDDTTAGRGLVLDGAVFELPSQGTDNTPADPTLSHVCRALGMQKQAALGALIGAKQAQQLPELRRTLPVFSALYRLSRLPRLLSPSLLEGQCIITLLAQGSPEVLSLLAGTPIIGGSQETPDILDTLVALANLAHWLKREQLSAVAVLNMLTPAAAATPIEPSIALTAHATLDRINSSLLAESVLAEYLQASPLKVKIPLETLDTLLDEHGLVKPFKASTLAATLKKLVPTLGDSATAALEALIVNAQIAQEDIAKHLISTAFGAEQGDRLLSAGHALPLLRWVQIPVHTLLADILGANSQAVGATRALTPELWNEFSRHAMAVKLLGLSPAGLSAMLDQPDWFGFNGDKQLAVQTESNSGDAGGTESNSDNASGTESTGGDGSSEKSTVNAASDTTLPQTPLLNLDLCYQFSRYRTWVETAISQGFAEADVLHFFAERLDSDQPGNIEAKAKRLGDLLGWDEREVALAFRPQTFDDFLKSLNSYERERFDSWPAGINYFLEYYHESIAGKEQWATLEGMLVKFDKFLKANPGPLLLSPKWYEQAKYNKSSPDGGWAEYQQPDKMKWSIKRELNAGAKFRFSPLAIKPLNLPADSVIERVPCIPTTISDIDFIMRQQALCKKTGLSYGSLRDLAVLDEAASYSEYAAAANVLLAQYNEPAMTELLPALHEKWRDALIAYLLGYWVAANPALQPLIRNANELSDYFLAETQVAAGVDTNPLAFAIASLQHYLHRLYSHLEPGYGPLQASAIDAWHQYRSQYGLWKKWRDQINQPENLIYYANRPNKSTAFQELEVDTNQGKLDIDSLHTAINTYLAKFERLSNLQVISGYLDGSDPKNDTYHLIGKSNTAPPEYFWRTLDMGLRDDSERLSPLAWSEWERINIPVSGNLALAQYKKTVVIPKEPAAGDAEELIAARAELTENIALKEALKERIHKMRFWRDSTVHGYYIDSGTYYVVAPDPSTKILSHKAFQLELERYKSIDTNSTKTLEFHRDAIYPVVIDGRSYTFWVERGTTGLPSNDAKNQTPTKYRSISVKYSFQQSDGSWSQANELLVLDGTLNGKREGKDADNPRLKDDTYKPALVVTVITEGERSSDPWLGVLLYDSAKGELGTANDNYFIELRDLLLVENKDLKQKENLCKLLYNSYNDIRNIRHVYDGPPTTLKTVEISTDFTTNKLYSEDSSRYFSNYDNPNAIKLYPTIGKTGNSLSFRVACDVIPLDALISAHGSAAASGQHKGIPYSLKAFFDIDRSNIKETGKINFILVAPDTKHLKIGAFVRNEEKYLPQALTEANGNWSGELEVNTVDLLDLTFTLSVYLDSSEPMMVQLNIKHKTDRATNATITLLSPDEKLTLGFLYASSEDPIFHIYNCPLVDDEEYPIVLNIQLSSARARQTIDIIKKYKIKKTKPLIDEPWNISLHHNVQQAQYLSLNEVADMHPTLAMDNIRLNTLFGKDLVARASRSVESALEWDSQLTSEPTLDEAHITPPLDFHGGNGGYFRELFLHLPAMVATRLTEQQQYEDAERWYLQYLFDPYRTEADELGRPPFWNTRPLAEVGTGRSVLRKEVDPIARAFSLSRQYRQAVFLGLVDNWQRQGDHYYRQMTLSTLNHAWLCYQQALNLIGPLPERAAVSRWIVTPLSDVNIHNFRVPLNERVLKARRTLEQRLYNLRHGLTIDGKALPRLDWGGEAQDAFASTKGGLSLLNNTYNSDYMAIPAYRFRHMLPLARNAARQLLDMGHHYMKLMEDEFNTSLSVLLKEQEIRISDFTLKLKQESINSVHSRRQVLETSRQAALARKARFTHLIEQGLTLLEEASSKAAWVSATTKALASAPAVVKGAVMTVPTIFGFSVGGAKFEGPVGGVEDVLKYSSEVYGLVSGRLSELAGHQRRASGWQFELEQADWDVRTLEKELEELDVELNAATISLEEARQERTNLNEALVAMTTGFTIIPIYNWLVARQELIYGAAYDAVLSLCLSAEAAWRYEIGDYQRNAFIKPSGWSDTYKGMLAGEALMVDLQEMENAYLQANELRVGIKRRFSLKGDRTADQWKTLVGSLATHPLEFEFKAEDYDRSYPGHYLRQIRRITVTFVMEANATFENISAVLTQVTNTTLVAPIKEGLEYLYGQISTPPASVKRNLRAQQQIALSAASADDGLGLDGKDWQYELMFEDGRYFPFEGTGAISAWSLSFPDKDFAKELAGKDKTPPLIKDIHVNVTYTARDGGDELKRELLAVKAKPAEEPKPVEGAKKETDASKKIS